MGDAELFGVLHRIKTKQWGNGRRGVLVMMCEEGGKSTNIWHDSGGRERLSKLSTRGTATNTMKIQRERDRVGGRCRHENDSARTSRKLSFLLS